MARSKKRLHMLQERRRKQKIRREEQLEKCQSRRETSGIENSFERLKRRRKSHRKLVREAIIRFFVCIAAFIAVCYFIAKFIADKI